jgi:hypothetical protein
MNLGLFGVGTKTGVLFLVIVLFFLFFAVIEPLVSRQITPVVKQFYILEAPVRYLHMC